MRWPVIFASNVNLQYYLFCRKDLLRNLRPVTCRGEQTRSVQCHGVAGKCDGSASSVVRLE